VCKDLDKALCIAILETIEADERDHHMHASWLSRDHIDFAISIADEEKMDVVENRDSEVELHATPLRTRTPSNETLVRVNELGVTVGAGAPQVGRVKGVSDPP
jgi:hypothetical protein